MQINSINQQPNFSANTIYAKKAMAIDPKTKRIVASYTDFVARPDKFKGVLKLLPGYAEQSENKMFLIPKDFGDIICITCKNGQESRMNVAKYLNESSKKGFEKIVIE